MADNQPTLLTMGEIQAMADAGDFDSRPGTPSLTDKLTPPEKAMLLKYSIEQAQKSGKVMDDAGGLSMMGGKLPIPGGEAVTNALGSTGKFGLDALNFVKTNTPAILKNKWVQSGGAMAASQMPQLPPSMRNMLEMFAAVRGLGAEGGAAAKTAGGMGAITEAEILARNASAPKPMQRIEPPGGFSTGATIKPPPQAPAIGLNVAPETSNGLNSLKEALTMPPERGGTMKDVFERVTGGGMSAEGKDIATASKRGPAPNLDPRSSPGDFESLMKGDTKTVKLKTPKKKK